MKNKLMKMKREFKPFLIAYILFDIIIIGSLVVSASSIPEGTTNSFKQFEHIFQNIVPNMINFKFITAIFVDFFKFVNYSFWTFVATIVLFIVWKIKMGGGSEYEGKESGSSDWSKSGEEYSKLEDGSEVLNKKEGFILSTKHYLNTDLRKVKINKNILVFGGSGTGKSACYIKPNILQCLGSYVITDPKGELYRETANFLKAQGYKVRAFNLVDAEFSDKYNPLAHIKDHSDIDTIAHSIIEGGGEGKSSDPFWDNTAKMLLKACIYYVISVLPEEEQNLSSCLNIVRAGGSDDSVLDRLFIDELTPEHPGRKEYEGIRFGADKTKQSIAISLVSKLSHFDTPNIKKITTTNDIDFQELGNEKTAIFVITPADHSTYDYILTIFFSQLLQTLYAQANKNGGTLRNQVYLLLDEFANIGQIPDFNRKLSTTRSLGISVSIIVQSLDQLEGLYKDTYENILGNCDTQIFLGSQSLKTCEYFSKSLGQKTIKFHSVSVTEAKGDGDKPSKSKSEQRQGRDLMTVDELKRMPFDEEIILVRGLKPIRTKKAWYFKYHPLKDIIGNYLIKDHTQMPRPKPVEVKTMDVEKHIEERVNLAKKMIQEKEEIKEKAKNKVEEKISLKEQEENFDLQAELEKKFNELFGETDNH